MTALMIWGTSGQVGKSLLSIGLCRALKNESFPVLPFKSIAVSRDLVVSNGLVIEQGVAELAEACGISAQPYMSPIILFPKDARVKCDLFNNDYEVELYLSGKRAMTTTIGKLSESVEWLQHQIEDSMRILFNSSKRLLIEGSGSPIEGSTLGKLANITTANIAAAKCLLVTDCARGAPVAAALGTAMLLGKDMTLVRGLVLNQSIGPIISDEALSHWVTATDCPIVGNISQYGADLPENYMEAIRQESDKLPEEGRLRTECWYDLLSKIITQGLDMKQVRMLLHE